MSKIADTEANATSLDGLVNDNGLITTLRNGPKPSWQYIVDQVYAQLGYAVAGSFVAGFTYTGIRQVGVDASGNTWIYTGGQQNIPHTVPAGTVPSSPEYFQVSVNSADNVVLDNGENLQQAIDRLNSEIDNLDASSIPDANGGTIQDLSNKSLKRFADVVFIDSIGVEKEPKGTIAESITKSNEIVAAMAAYAAANGTTTFYLPRGFYVDAQTLYAGVPVGSSLMGDLDDDGTSYTGYQSKAQFTIGGDTQDNDSRAIIASGHNALLNLFNAQLPNTGNGGSGQSESSLEGKCSITFQAGYSTVNGREVRTNTSRVQRYQTGGVGPIHLGIQHPTETDEGTRTLFDFDSNGNVSFGGTSTDEDYNLLIYPQNTNTPALDKRTTLGLRNVQPSGNGIRVEMVARDADGTQSFALNYDSKDFMMGDFDSLKGDVDGNIERYLLGRNTKPGDQSRVVVYDDGDRGGIFVRNTLATGLARTMLSLQVGSSTRAYTWLNCYDTDAAITRFTVSALGDVTANSYTPFTGCHLFFSENPINIGCPVDLVDCTPVKYKNTVEIDGEPVNENLELIGTVSPSGLKSKICAGVIQSQQVIDGGYLCLVAAVGDNISGELKGFKVNDEGGDIEAGDILCTSSTEGELMKTPSGEPESVVRFKCMQTPVDGICYGYF